MAAHPRRCGIGKKCCPSAPGSGWIASGVRHVVGSIRGAASADARGEPATNWIESVGADIRFALKLFARKPLSSTTIVLVLAIGIAGCATAYGLLQSAIMRPPPGVPDDVSLVLVRRMARPKEQPLWSRARFSYPTLREMSAMRSVFSAVAGWTESTVTVDAVGALDGATARAQFVTDGYFSILGVRPAYGSTLPTRHRLRPLSRS